MDDRLAKNFQEQLMYSLVDRVFRSPNLQIEAKKQRTLLLGRRLGKKTHLLLNKHSINSVSKKDGLKSLIEDLWPQVFGRPTDVFYPNRDTASFKEHDFRFIKRVDSNCLDPDEQKEYCLLLLVFIEGLLQGALHSLHIEFKLEVIYKNECLFVHIDVADSLYPSK